MWIITTAYDNAAPIYRLGSTHGFCDNGRTVRGAKGRERGEESVRRDVEKWAAAERGRSAGCHYERWSLRWIIHHTSAVCLLLLCDVTRINADKPRGNSDYCFQQITMRGKSRKTETGERWEDRWKAKHKESHMEHTATSTVGFLKI